MFYIWKNNPGMCIGINININTEFVHLHVANHWHNIVIDDFRRSQKRTYVTIGCGDWVEQEAWQHNVGEGQFSIW